MNRATCIAIISLPLIVLAGGCQLINTGTETRSDEQMLKVSFENARTEELFRAIVNGTEQESHGTRIGSPSFSLYSRTETLAFNAHCNDHIRAMDTNSDLLITQKEAEDYTRYLIDNGKVTRRK